MSREEFLRKLSEILETDELLTGAESLADLEKWDSLAVLNFMALADESYNVTVSPKDIAACKTVNDLVVLTTGKIG